jgi:superfamily II DNA or RNA helicase
MNGPEAAKLIGFINPRKATPSFLVPIFEHDGSFWVQNTNPDGKLVGFEPCDVDRSDLDAMPESPLSLPGSLSANAPSGFIVDRRPVVAAGDLPIFAFMFQDGKCEFGRLSEMRGILERRLAELKPYPFVAIEVYEFLDRREMLVPAFEAARDLLRENDSSIAERWFRANVPQRVDRVLWQPGQRVRHAEFGEGVVLAEAMEGLVKVFFPAGERQVPVDRVTPALSRSEAIIANVRGDSKRALRAWLCYQAHALPLMDNVSTLTSAKIDLLPHQVVLTHRVATASPRRFLIADEVGLGKTIETALILRELISRGELRRALMVVPAGLVNNWHRELNEVFRLNFEVFGSEGDVTDRKSNAFEKHNLLIASIDTLKLRARMTRLKAAPPWDLVVFDEAHHLTAYQQSGKLVKTQNFRLAEMLKEHTRDLLLLSATPHQGDHFRFWMLVQMLDPTLFNSPSEMVEHRHRLNSVVFRRTKADACQPDGSTLFARRQVHTEAFTMSETEKVFYDALVAYLQDGFALAKRRGKSGQGLAFVMTIFQKIAASSFAAVQRTLRRRLIALTIQESLLHDQKLDIDSRNAALDEARELIRELHGIADGRLGDAEIDRLLADYRYKILRTQRDQEEALRAGADESGWEARAADAEDAAISTVSAALPEERRRIKDLLVKYPPDRETKVKKLIDALGVLWRENPQERMVVFATYLGSVEMLGAEIEKQYPGQGVTVLKGGDHGAKAAAEKRFKAVDGPRILISTAAGREGINLQHARILFNFDLPWNPMDLEQRIGRIHRYGQHNTAQVYNLVLADTIEGAIFLLLDEKLKEIGRALGKVDERGEIAEDLRTQILGQLSMQLNYASLYSAALSDPLLKRTRVEVETAMSNAVEARKVVFELFQDLEGFRIDDYKAMGNPDEGMEALVRFVADAAIAEGDTFRSRGEKLFEWIGKERATQTALTTDRDISMQNENIELLGLDHPLVASVLKNFRDLPPEELGICVQSPDGANGILTVWSVEARGDKGQVKRVLVPLAVDDQGRRVFAWERQPEKLWRSQSASRKDSETEKKRTILREFLEPMLQRELEHQGLASGSRGFEAKLIGWVEAIAS